MKTAYMNYFSRYILIALIVITLSACTYAPKSNSDATDIHKKIGDEITLDTLDLKVNSVEENQLISSYYGSTAYAAEGSKFVLIVLELINTTDEDFEYVPDLKLVDEHGNEYNSYQNTINNINNHIENRKLDPGIRETGYIVYEIPEDSTSYSIMTSGKDKNEMYEIKLK